MSKKSDAELTVSDLKLGVYVHYKDPSLRYEVLGVGLDSETEQPVVIYKPLYASQTPYWVRPYGMFVGDVIVDGITRPRFSWVGFFGRKLEMYLSLKDFRPGSCHPVCP